MNNLIPLTEQGYKKLEDEKNQLKTVERPSVIKMIAQAREYGDLSENAEYHAAREKQGFIEGRISQIEGILAKSQVINPATITSEKVMFGATVTIVDLDTDKKFTYQLVSDAEANLEEGLISLSSPLGKSLLQKETGDIVDITTNKEEKSWEILKIEYK